ncbi:MAG: DUF2069 domain-containing protein [Proteobacteria bacterium]|nr:DUF2069 domain-containing protein [Pseudomonadota bacterium]MBS0464493.1 DUF2069 domain-containing protein [Pseudomonadota bacterium]
MSSRALAIAATLALLLLQWRWHAQLAPPAAVAPWALATFYSLPLLPCLWLALRRNVNAPLAGAIAALLYFCHGVMFAMGAPPLRGPALIEIALSLTVVFAASWNGLRARFLRR